MAYPFSSPILRVSGLLVLVVLNSCGNNQDAATVASPTASDTGSGVGSSMPPSGGLTAAMDEIAGGSSGAAAAGAVGSPGDTATAGGGMAGVSPMQTAGSQAGSEVGGAVVDVGTGGAAPLGDGSMGGSAASGGGPETTPDAGAEGASDASDAPTPCAEPGPGTHFVDSDNGADNNDGSSPDSAWQSLDRVNTETYGPGDSICFIANGSWVGELAPTGSGSEEAPIFVGQYGDGDKPIIAAGTDDLQALLLQNVQYVEVTDLELTNDKGGPGDYRGISVRGKDVGALNHIYIRNTYVHDVTGHVYWIGGDEADSSPPWVTFKTGWDASKRTGGIVFEIESDNGTKTWFNDVRVENNVVQNTSFGGIIFKQLEGSYGWGVRNSTNDSSFTPHTNVIVRGNFISQSDTEYGCNTIYMTGAQHVLIEGNVCKDSGTSAIEAYNSDDVVIQHNETFGTVRKAGGADSNGIDADRATTDAVIQYNYIHDNGDGILLAQFSFGNSIVRYNLIINSSRWGINIHSDSSASNQTYNNLFFINGLNSGDLTGSSGGSSYLNSGSYVFSNNIFSSTRSSLVSAGTGVTYENNLFDGVAVTGSGALTGSPLFVDSSSWPDGDASGPALDGLAGFQLQDSSPAIDKGKPITDNGGFDFWGNPLGQGMPDIGPFERP